MNLKDSSFNFHDGALVSFQVGPRNELTLHLWLNPISNHPAGAIALRLGAITNMAQISPFFAQIHRPTTPGQFIDGIIELSQPDRRTIRLELDHHGAVEIHSEKISLPTRPAPVPTAHSLEPISVADVLADLASLERKTIKVRGLLAVQHENHSLADTSHAEPAHRLWVNFHHASLGMRKRDLDTFDRAAVLATGTVSRQKKGHFGLFPATLTVHELTRQ